MNVDQDEDPIVIELYAQQFNWKARYSGEDNALGKANVRLIDIDRANILGLDEFDPNAQDDIITTELHLPVGKPVLFKMRSQDVLHSAYMPHFRAQMNCVPGMVTQFDKNDVEEAGLVKFDFLGLSNLTILRQAVDLIEENRDIWTTEFKEELRALMAEAIQLEKEFIRDCLPVNAVGLAIDEFVISKPDEQGNHFDSERLNDRIRKVTCAVGNDANGRRSHLHRLVRQH